MHIFIADFHSPFRMDKSFTLPLLFAFFVLSKPQFSPSFLAYISQYTLDDMDVKIADLLCLGDKSTFSTPNVMMMTASIQLIYFVSFGSSSDDCQILLSDF